MEISQHGSHNHIVIQIAGELDLAGSRKMKEQLHWIARQNPTAEISLDLRYVDFVASHGVSVLLAFLLAQRDAGRPVHIQDVSKAVRRAFEVLELRYLIPVQGTSEAMYQPAS